MLAQKLIFSYLNQIIVQILQIAASLVVARLAGPGVLGTIAFAMSYVSMFSFVADLGFGTAHIKKISEGLDLEKGLGTYTRIKITLIILYTIIVIVFFLIQKNIFKTSFESIDHIYAIFIFLASSIITQTYSICKATFQAFAQQVRTDLPDFFVSLINQVLRIIIVVLGYKAVALSFGNLASVILIIPFYWYLFKGYKIGKFDISIAKEYWIIAMPVLLTAVTSTLLSTLGVVLLQFYSNSEQVGYYSAGFRIGGFVLLISLSIGNLFFPIFSKAASNKDFETIKKYVEKFERFSFIYLMPIIIIVTLFSSEIVRLLLGKQFIASVPIMMMINLSMFFRVLASPYGSLIAGLGLFKKSLIIGLVHFIFYILALYFAINPPFLNLSGYGAALAYLLATVVFFILNITYAMNNLRLLTFKNLIMYMSFGIVNFVIAYYIFQLINVNSIIAKLCFIVFYFVITYSLMFFIGLLNKNDLKIAKTIFDFKSMNKYIHWEVRNKYK